jgi:hypothetical protein
MKRLTGLQVFDWLVVGLMITLGLATVLIPVGLAAGRGDVVVDATVARPYGILFPGGRSIEVGTGGGVVRHNFHEGDEARHIKAPPSIAVQAQVDRGTSTPGWRWRSASSSRWPWRGPAS